MSAPRSLKLRDDETMRFIQLYQNDTLLYDLEMVEYCNRDLRAALAKRTVDDLNASGFGPGGVMTKSFKSNSIASTKQDSYDYFGKYIAPLLRDMGPTEGMELQHDVTGLVLTKMQKTTNNGKEPRTSAVF
ncbi:hypothetical protein PR048_000516 [Dryococelus australis]|uniref:Uncharacterized protein n=1 Tax=Dryococelus australis TaxID=614101 RepID=A0ABQ9IFS5_9NEOP|nr:hypothetical protein PR048_000516 [Dryococelus australis]